jgi:hypothetical protein
VYPQDTERCPLSIVNFLGFAITSKGFATGSCNSKLVFFPMPIPPPLPDDWPFKAEKGSLSDAAAHESSLPGLEGTWQVFGAAALSGLNEAELDPKPMDGMFGRGGLIQAGGYVFRPYRRGGLMRHFNKGIYTSASRFSDEYEVHAALWRAGFPTVEPIGYAYRKHFWGAEGVFITRKADALPWPKVWGSGDHPGNDSFVHVRQIAVLIKALSAWGLWSPDMNATNFLMGHDGRVLALDWDRAKWAQKNCLTVKYWTRLRRSMYKLNAPAALIALMQDELMEVPHEN